MGGKDPYSASKACAEIIINCYRESFFEEHEKSVSSARAGNVIGGGDWSQDRLIPDAIRAFTLCNPLVLRYPNAIRPWQHVLDALSGYLILAEAQWSDHRRFAKAWNFGPDTGGEKTVGHIAYQMATLWGSGAEVVNSPSTNNLAESGLLRLDSSMARRHLGWIPRWSLQKTLKKTSEWYKAWNNNQDMMIFSIGQIEDYLTVKNNE